MHLSRTMTEDAVGRGCGRLPKGVVRGRRTAARIRARVRDRLDLRSRTLAGVLPAWAEPTDPGARASARLPAVRAWPDGGAAHRPRHGRASLRAHHDRRRRRAP